MLFVSTVLTQELPRIKSYTKIDYPGKRQNWDIDQLANGTICIANTDGLLTFDGYHWNRFPLEDGQILRAIEVKDDTIFAGAYGEFGYWSPNQPMGSRSFVSLVDASLRPSMDQDEIWNIIVDSNESVYAQSFGRIYRKNGQKLLPIYPQNTIRFLYQLDSQLVLQVKDQGLYEVTDDSLHFLLAHPEIMTSRVKSMLCLNEADWLIGTENHGLLRIMDGNMNRFKTDIDVALKREQINKMILLRGGLIGIGTILNGLYIINQRGELIYHYSKANGLINNTVLALFEDADGNLWIGLDNGLAIIDLQSPIRYWHDIDGELGTPYTAFEKYGNLYVGTNHGLFVRPLKKADTNFELIGGTQGQVWELKELGGDLFCAHNMGVFKVLPKGIEWISEGAGVYTLEGIKGTSNSIVAGTYSGINVIKERDDGSWETTRLDFDHGARWLAVDSAENLWITGANRGLYRLQCTPDYQHVQSVTNYPTFDRTRPFLQLDANDDLQVSLAGACYQLQRGAERFSLVSEDLIQPDHFLKMVLGKDGFTFYIHRSYTEVARDGRYLGRLQLVLDESSESIIPLSKQRYFLSLIDGYAIVDLGADITRSQAWQPRVTKLEALDKRGNLLFSHIDPVHADKVLKLPHRAARIRMSYTDNSFLSAGTFKHQLLGFDEDWSAWRQRSISEYTNLPPGEYVLKLASEGRVNHAALVVTMTPKWYQTLAFRVAAGFAIMGLGYLIYIIYQRRIKTHKRRLKIEHQRALNRQLLEMRAKQLEQDVLNKSKELANSTMTLVQKNEVLYSILTSLKEVKKELGIRFPDKYYHNVEQLIQRNLSERDDWQLFETNFNGVHQDFFGQLRRDYPDLTPGELKLAAYLKMNLSTKEIAQLLKISTRGVENKRYRLRKKMALPHEENLVGFLMQY